MSKVSRSQSNVIRITWIFTTRGTENRHCPKESDTTESRSLLFTSHAFTQRLIVTTLNRSEMNGIKLFIRSVALGGVSETDCHSCNGRLIRALRTRRWIRLQVWTCSPSPPVPPSSHWLFLLSSYCPANSLPLSPSADGPVSVPTLPFYFLSTLWRR